MVYAQVEASDLFEVFHQLWIAAVLQVFDRNSLALEETEEHLSSRTHSQLESYRYVFVRNIQASVCRPPVLISIWPLP